MLCAPVLLLLGFALLAPGRRAVAGPVPSLRCADFLARMHRKAPHLVFVGCRPLPDQQGRPLRATYRVVGRQAAGVDAFLVRATGLEPLHRSCCQQVARPRPFTDRVGHPFTLPMASSETIVPHSAQWPLICSVQAAMDASAEEILTAIWQRRQRSSWRSFAAASRMGAMSTLRSAFLPASAWLAAALLVACAAPGQDHDSLTRRFDAAGVTRVVFRAAAADTATVDVVPGTGGVTLSGRATGGAEGYHPADPRWRETPATEWGLDFVAKRFGSVLVISTANEIDYVHHHYAIAGIGLRLPPSVELVRQVRALSGDGKADLAPP